MLLSHGRTNRRHPPTTDAAVARVTRAAGDRARLLADLEAEGLFVLEWTDEPGTRYPEHAHPGAETRVVLDGTMTVVADGTAHVLGPGDRIDLAPDEAHEAAVGPDGVRYLSGSPEPPGHRDER